MRYLPESTVNVTVMPTGDLVLLESRSGKLYRGNRTSAAMWNALLEQDGHMGAAADIVARKLHADPAQVRADLARLATELARAGIMRAEP